MTCNHDEVNLIRSGGGDPNPLPICKNCGAIIVQLKRRTPEEIQVYWMEREAKWQVFASQFERTMLPEDPRMKLKPN